MQRRDCNFKKSQAPVRFVFLRCSFIALSFAGANGSAHPGRTRSRPDYRDSFAMIQTEPQRTSLGSSEFPKDHNGACG